LREYLLAELGRIDDTPTVASAQAVWRALQPGIAAGQPPSRLSPALVGLIGRHADGAQFEQLRRQARTETESERRSLLWHSLAGNRDATLARQAMALARGDEVPASDAPWLLEAAAQAGHIDASWSELRQHHGVLFADMADWDRAELAPALLNGASDVRMADALLAWTPGVLGSQAMPAAAKAAGTIRVNAALARRALPDLARWLATLPAPP
jgi:hypothetical protein